MANDPNRRDRIESDALSALMNEKINDLAGRLEQHVTDCTAQSRKLFWAVLAVLGWLVAHSLPFVGKMFP